MEITELPIGTWTQPYKEQLEKWVTGTDNNPAYVKVWSARGCQAHLLTCGPSMQDYKEYHTNTSVHFVITMTKEGMAKAEEEGLLKFFKLTGSINTTNMMAFDSNLKLRKYASPEEILEDFFPLRLQFYQKRKVSIEYNDEIPLLTLFFRSTFATSSAINGTSYPIKLVSCK